MRPRSLAVAAVALTALCPVPAAAASTAGEARAGEAVLTALASHATSCAALTDDELEQVGELAVRRAVGSTTGHDALDARMADVMGVATAHRMHVLMGRRYAGCVADAGDAAGSMMGGGGTGTSTDVDGAMMGDGTSTTVSPRSTLPDHAAMMGLSDWRWMRDGAWRTMSGAQWTTIEARWRGPGMMARTSGDSSPWAPLIAGGLLVALLVALAAVLRPPAGGTPS